MNRKENREDRAFLEVVAFVAAGTLAYCAVIWFSIPMPHYYPLSHEWKWSVDPGVPSQGWFAAQAFALGVGVLAGWVVHVAAGRWRAFVLSAGVVRFIAVATLVLLVGCLAFLMLHEFRRWGVVDGRSSDKVSVCGSGLASGGPSVCMAPLFVVPPSGGMDGAGDGKPEVCAKATHPSSHPHSILFRLQANAFKDSIFCLCDNRMGQPPRSACPTGRQRSAGQTGPLPHPLRRLAPPKRNMINERFRGTPTFRSCGTSPQGTQEEVECGGGTPTFRSA